MSDRPLHVVPAPSSRKTPARTPRKAAAPRKRAPAKKAAPPPKPKPLTLTEAVESGDYLEILKAQRRDIVKAIPGEKGQAKATFHRQLIAISKEIRELELAKAPPTNGNGNNETGVVASTSDESWNQSAI